MSECDHILGTVYEQVIRLSEYKNKKNETSDAGWPYNDIDFKGYSLECKYCPECGVKL